MTTTVPSTPSDRDLGVLLIGHGTASEIGTRQFLHLARQLADLLAPTPVEPAFLELQQPDIATGLRRLIEREVMNFVASPLLLFAAGHDKRDIPDQLQSAAAAAHQAAHLGCHSSIVELSQKRYGDALRGKPQVPPAETALVLIGRGSRDESATAEMLEFARLRHQPETASEVFVGFLAMAQPSLADVLADVARRGCRRVVVQPHLLFAGELADTVEREVGRVRAQNPEQEWLVTPVLADSSCSQESPTSGNRYLLRAIGDRIQEAIHVVASGPDG